MSEPKIYFDCSSCGREVWAPPRGAGRNAPCPKCGTSCEIPFPGKNQLRLRCGTDGTEYGLDHVGPCEVCDEADDFQRFCLRHQTTIDAEPCLECVRAAEQDFQKRKHPEKRKARKKTTRRNKQVPPALPAAERPATPRLPTTPVTPSETPREGTVENYLVQSILCLLFCGTIFAIPAIVYAAQVNPKLRSGDYEGAVQASKDAKKWCVISFCLGLVCCGGSALFNFLAAVAESAGL